MSVGFMAEAVWAAMLIYSASPQVQSHTLKEGAIYHLRVAQGGLVALRFPFGCMKAWAPQDKVHLEVHPQLEDHVIAMTPRLTAIGSVVNGTIACQQGVSIAVAMHVVEEAEASPRVDFVWEGQDATVAGRMVAHAVAVEQDRCQQQLRQVQNTERTGLDMLAQQARGVFSVVHRRKSARVGHVVVHVDAQKRLGEFGLLEFRVQNRETGPVRISAVEVAGVGSQTPPFVFDAEETAAKMSLDASVGAGHTGDTADADSTDDAPPPATGAVVLPSLLLKAGSTTQASVAFAWPADASRFVLTVRFFAPEPRVIEVGAIDF